VAEEHRGYAETLKLSEVTGAAKLRVYLIRRRTLLLVVLPVLVLLGAHPRPVPYAIGVLLVLLGQALRFWSAGYIVKATQLTTTGPYAHVRNPLYLGSLLITCGWGAMSGRWELAALLVLVFAVTHGLSIAAEERYLRARFGAQFEEYCRQVPRLWPRLCVRPNSGGHFSWQQAIRCDSEGVNAVCVGLLAAIYGTRLWW